MKNYVQSGQNTTFIADQDYSSGDVVVVNNLVGICAFDVLTGQEGEMARTGVFKLPKEASLAVDQGQVAYWDGSEVDDKPADDGTNIEIGTFHKAALAADAEAEILLIGGARAFN